jgi:hypothetical protein
MPIIVREVEEKVINCLKIVLKYGHVRYPGKGLKSGTIQGLVQVCREQHKCEARLVQKTNEERTDVILWVEITSKDDPFGNTVFNSIQKNCTYDSIHMEHLQFSFDVNQLNTIANTKVATREDGIYISGEEPPKSNPYSFDYSKTIQDNNMYKRKLMKDYSSDHMKSLLSDSSESDKQGLKRMFVGGMYR